MKEEAKQELRKAWNSFFPALLFVVLIWGIKAFEHFSKVHLGAFGIEPLKMSGLKGILFSPLLHADLTHLASNTLPVLALGWSLIYFYHRPAYLIIALIWIGGGILVWFFGRPSFHIGASGLIYGMAAFLFFTGFIKKNHALLAISLLVTIFYGGMIWGMLPLQTSISWESHIAGAFMGLVCAWIFRHHGPEENSHGDTTESTHEHEHWNMDNMPVPPPFRIKHDEE